MAEGMSNLAIAARFQVTDTAIGKQTNNIFAKLGLPPSDDHNRRFMAVLAYLQAVLTPSRPPVQRCEGGSGRCHFDGRPCSGRQFRRSPVFWRQSGR